MNKKRILISVITVFVSMAVLYGCADRAGFPQTQQIQPTPADEQTGNLADIEILSAVQAESLTDAETSANEQAENFTDVHTNGFISTGSLIDCNFYNAREFISHTSHAREYEISGELQCGIVPHHLLAGQLISGFLQAAAENGEIDTIVITAPIHDPQNDKLCTTVHGWQTPFGVLEADTEISELFVSELGAVKNDEVLQADHSASSLIPYVKYYFPNVKAACLLIPKNAARATPQAVAELYESFAGKHTLFIFSVDFSHYLKPDETEKHDDQTRSAVLDGRTDEIAKMTDDNVDSPYCLNTFLLLSQGLGLTVRELDHSNSLTLSPLPYIDSADAEGLTSHFIFAGVKEQQR